MFVCNHAAIIRVALEVMKVVWSFKRSIRHYNSGACTGMVGVGALLLFAHTLAQLSHSCLNHSLWHMRIVGWGFFL